MLEKIKESSDKSSSSMPYSTHHTPTIIKTKDGQVLPLHLSDFLEQYNMRGPYLKNFDSNFDNLCFDTDNVTDWIIWAFPWTPSPERHDVWNKINKLWQAHLNHLLVLDSLPELRASCIKAAIAKTQHRQNNESAVDYITYLNAQ